MTRIRLRSLFITLGLLLVAGAQAAPFTVARLHYGGGGDWYSDPSSLVNLLSFAEGALGTDMAEEEAKVRIEDDELARYPYLYMTGHGNVRFDEQEAAGLRDYLEGGGFLHVDDNYGLDESFRRELRKVFPDKALQEIPFDHPIYHMRFDFPEGPPKIHEHDGEAPQGYGIVVDGRIVLFYTHEVDLGDGWEDPDVHDLPPALRTAALRMGSNIIAYVLAGKPRSDEYRPAP